LGDTGVYYYRLPSSKTASAGQYIALFRADSPVLDQKTIPSIWHVGTSGIEDIPSANEVRGYLEDVFEGTAEGYSFSLASLIGSPPAEPSVEEALMLMYMVLRNKTVTTSDLQQICNDSGIPIARFPLSHTEGQFTKEKLEDIS